MGRLLHPHHLVRIGLTTLASVCDARMDQRRADETSRTLEKAYIESYSGSGSEPHCTNKYSRSSSLPCILLMGVSVLVATRNENGGRMENDTTHPFQTAPDLILAEEISTRKSPSIK